MAAEEKGKPPPVTRHPDCDKFMTREYYDRYKAQSQELYTFLSRSFQDVFKFCEQPYQYGTHMSGSSVKAVPGDIVTAIFIILDLNEKTGWTERNTKREFFGHIDVFFGSEKSIKKAVKSVRNRIPDAKRIGVKIDYEIIRRCAIQLQFGTDIWDPKRNIDVHLNQYMWANGGEQTQIDLTANQIV